MIQELSSRLLRQLEMELEEISFAVLSPSERLSSASKRISFAVSKVKNFLSDHPFASVAEEIGFFKSIKPSFCHWQVYFSELFTIEENLPFGDAKMQELYFENEMVYIQRFFREHSLQYQYYRRGATELDNIYFVRNADVSNSMLLPVVQGVLDDFSTPCDAIFSKIKAFEKLREWLAERIAFLKGNGGKPYFQGSGDEELHWTGDSINLAEIAVGIHRTKQLNNGSASLGAIFRWLEEKFHVSIGVPSKRISEIKRRTKFSRTRFMDEMVEETLRSFDRDDEYDVGKK